MAQIAKLIDLTRSAVITNPDSFLENLMYTMQADAPEQPLPIAAFEGYNFLPTAYGYRSYFGISSSLDIDALTGNCDEILMYQFANFKNILVALKDDGIWVARPTATGNDWTQSVVYSVPSVGTYKQYTTAVIENKLYIYRQGEASVRYLTPTSIDGSDVVTFSTLTPSFLNMTGQLGIFRANGRLGFWDSSNSVSWSSLFSLSDFTPDLKTLAGNATFNGILGRIVTVLPQGDGFVIYATKSIVGVRYTTSNLNVIWEAAVITDAIGVSYPFQATKGLSDMEHYAFTTGGIKKIGSYNALNRSHQMEEILTSEYDFLKQTRDPVRMKLINGRFLCFLLAEPEFISGRVISSENSTDTLSISMTAPAVIPGLVIADISIAGVDIDVHIPSVTANLPANPVMFITPSTTQAWVPGVGTGVFTESYTDDDGIKYGTLVIPGDPSERYEGMYLRWSATGKSMMTSRDTAITPYNLDSSSVHVDNVGLNLGSQVDSGTADALVAGGTYTDEAQRTLPLAKKLGWTFPGINRVSASLLGVTDIHLAEFQATQLEEWTNFTTIQTATIAALNAATPIVGDVVTIPTGYVSDALRDAAREVLITADLATYAGSIRVGNTVTWSETVGAILSGTGAITSAAITGAGTSGAIMNMSKEFSGGYDIKRNYSKVYTEETLSDYLLCLSVYETINNLTVYPDMWAFRTFTDIACPYRTPHPYFADTYVLGWYQAATGTLAVDRAVSAFPGATLTVVSDAGNDTAVYTVLENFTGTTVTFTNKVRTIISPPQTITTYHDDPGLTQDIASGYINKYQITTSLTLVANPALSATSAASATIEKLGFGAYLSGTPDSSERYSYTVEGAFHPGSPGSSEGYWIPLTDYVVTRGWAAGMSYEIPGISRAYSYPAYSVSGTTVSEEYRPADAYLSYPGSTFVMQDGVPVPIYPTYVGFLCLDVYLKKWGKCKADFKSVVDYLPANDSSTAIPYSNLGMDAGLLYTDGKLKLFDANPSASYMRYGKIGFSRLGMTTVQEVRVTFSFSSTGSVELESSLDGATILDTSTIQNFNSAGNVILYASQVGRWHTIKLTGNFDLQYLEFRGNVSGRR